jgi:hypothetical protein
VVLLGECISESDLVDAAGIFITASGNYTTLRNQESRKLLVDEMTRKYEVRSAGEMLAQSKQP